MTEEERRRLIEERRKREMTSDAFQRHIQATLQARAAGRPDPAPVTESGELIRPYADPRDEMIASSPALVRPVYSVLDRMLRPGRAGMADRMNREYMEGLLQRDADQRRALAERQLIEAQGQKMQADAAVAGLQRTVAEGNEQERKAAAAKLREIGLATGRVAPQDPNLWRILAGQGGGGSRFTPSGEEVILKADGTTPVSTPPPEGEVVNPYMDMTSDRAISAYTRDVRIIDNVMARAQDILDNKAGDSFTTSGIGGLGSARGESTPNQKIQARETLRRGELEKARLTEQIKAAHNWSPTSSNLEAK